LSSSLAQTKQLKTNELLVAAAADLTDVEPPLRQAFGRLTGVHIRFILGASGMLTRQIEQGAPYDVFLSADERFVSELVNEKKLEPDSVRTYAYGRLGLWSKSGSIRDLQQLREARILHVAIANPAHAPYGVAARDLLKNMGLWQPLQPKLVYGETVRQALEYARSGNADAAITAWPLVYNRGGILLPDTGQAPIRQAGGVVAGSPNAAAARRFLDFLTSDEGRRILETHGLGLPPK
jgi:molybdate transport system substrate-binding protein